MKTISKSLETDVSSDGKRWAHVSEHQRFANHGAHAIIDVLEGYVSTSLHTVTHARTYRMMQRIPHQTFHGSELVVHELLLCLGGGCSR